MKIFDEQKGLEIDLSTIIDGDVKISPLGFREYDVRWLYPKDINKKGLELFGYSLGKFISDKKGASATIVVGQDYRSYSEEVKYHLVRGLMSANLHVIDIGLSLSPMVYFAQHHFDTDSLAMVTASHNENGWTGIKCGIEKSLTFGPDEVSEIKRISEDHKLFQVSPGGTYKFIKDVRVAYLDYLVNKKIEKKIKVVVACGNGTAGAFAPSLLRKIGCEVIELHCDLNFEFPNYNPNPEDIVMLEDLASAVKEHDADVGFAFDGDGDRLGVVDDKGEEIFSDKIGLLMAESLAEDYPNSRFVIDVKSTGLYQNSKILKNKNCEIDMWKTGHSYMKRRVREINALCGFEKSGHFFINQPLGLGFDDGLKSACLMVNYLQKNLPIKLSEIRTKIPQTYQSPTMAPFCKDEEKYEVVDDLINKIQRMQENEETFAKLKIKSINTINGIRFEFENNSWGLIRASSNKPSLVIVIESFKSDDEVKEIFNAINQLLKNTGKVGKYDQSL